MPTGTETAKRILRIIGAIDPGETPTAQEQLDVITAINALLDQWVAQGITIYTPITESFDLVNGTAEYTIGDGATFDTVRPESIDLAWIRDGAYDYPIEVIDEQRYQFKTVKGSTGRPQELFYKPNYPLGTIYLYFTPDSSDYDLYLSSRKPLTAVAPTVDYDYPPTFDNAICFNTALMVAPEFGVEPSQNVYMQAQKALDAVISQNIVNNARSQSFDLFYPKQTNILNA